LPFRFLLFLLARFWPFLSSTFKFDRPSALDYGFSRVWAVFGMRVYLGWGVRKLLGYCGSFGHSCVFFSCVRIFSCYACFLFPQLGFTSRKIPLLGRQWLPPLHLALARHTEPFHSLPLLQRVFIKASLSLVTRLDTLKMGRISSFPTDTSAYTHTPTSALAFPTACGITTRFSHWHHFYFFGSHESFTTASIIKSSSREP